MIFDERRLSLIVSGRSESRDPNGRPDTEKQHHVTRELGKLAWDVGYSWYLGLTAFFHFRQG